MRDWASFGNPEEFSLRLRWVNDTAPRARRPAGHGWSLGEMEITVAGVNVTASSLQGERQTCIRWYLSPLLQWLAGNWIDLLHEEQLPWPGRRRVGSGAAALQIVADEWVEASDAQGQETYERIQRWYKRHGLRAVATGGVFPDVFLRRSGDDIEVSWSGDAPEFTPKGLTFESGSGRVLMPVRAVAKPIWQALQWAKKWARENQAGMPAFRKDMDALVACVAKLESLSANSLLRRAMPAGVFEAATAAFDEANRLDLLDYRRSPSIPVLEEFSPAVAMLSGVAPHLDADDIKRLGGSLVAAHGGHDCERLAELIASHEEEPRAVPRAGRRLASEVLEELYYPRRGHVDVLAMCKDLEIQVNEIRLETDSIRGATFAGEGFSPQVLVNATHPNNEDEKGTRSAIAHELCHVLFDRSRGGSIAHASSDWAPPDMELRADAFAENVLMPRELVVGAFREPEPEHTTDLADQLGVNPPALIQQLSALDLIGSADRVRLLRAVRERSLERGRDRNRDRDKSKESDRGMGFR